MSSAARTPEPFSIGELRSALLPDFPDITISKIRYLEDAGLIHPARTASSYRKFSHEDLARIRYVLTQQRDRYLPLKVIKEKLDAIDRGEGADGERMPILSLAANGLPESADFARQNNVRLKRSELLEAAGISEDLLDSMEQFGVVTPGRGGQYDVDALEIAAAVGQMAEFGIEARHLRPFRTAAQREVDLFEQVVAPMLSHRTPESRGRAEETVRELSALSVRLHSALVRAGLRRQLGN